MEKQKNIGRIDGMAGYGWYVRICVNGKFQYKGIKTQKFFSDSFYGGKEESLKEAISHRDSIIRILPKKIKQRVLKPRRTHEASGVKHITHSVQPSKKLNTDLNSWAVTYYSVLGKRRKKKFSWDKFGKHKAFSLAVIEFKKIYSISSFPVPAKLRKGGGFYSKWKCGLAHV